MVKVVKATEIEEMFEGPKKKRKKNLNSQPKKKKKIRLSFEEILIRDVKTIQNISKNDLFPNFLTMTADESRYPRRFFCCVCGFLSKYTCIRCGERFCSKKCGVLHKETQCLKFAD